MQEPPFTFEEFLRSQDLVRTAKLISLNEPYSLAGCQIVEESKSRNLETCNYPGSKVKQLSELPRHLEAPELWDLVIKAQHSQVCTLSSTILNRSC
ncbi:protein FAM227B [Haliaeetus albicilla]|uniref:protein FAM227B n=1 Tax=Haliaeetus albicilla TaxID=8969 RepID=UPI0037E908CB